MGCPDDLSLFEQIGPSGEFSDHFVDGLELRQDSRVHQFRLGNSTRDCRWSGGEVALLLGDVLTESPQYLSGGEDFR